VELLFQLERTFGIEISFDELDIENFRTVDTIAGYIEMTNRSNAA
jgi:acyl carrier protein